MQPWLSGERVSAYFIATNAITKVTVEFFEFKVNELEKYVESQWRLLVENDLTGREDMVGAAQAGIEVFARSILRSETEIIFAIDGSGNIVLTTADTSLVDSSRPFGLQQDELTILTTRAGIHDRALSNTQIDTEERVTMGFLFEPFDWYFVVTESKAVFYAAIDQIAFQTFLLVIVGSAFMAVLLLVFVRLITSPLSNVVGAMKKIIQTNDFSANVPVSYRDEIGQMSNTFNIMISELDKAYTQIKKYAFEAVVSQKKENKIRNIFQKYVPQELIDQFFANPEAMLVGENRKLAILFADIRSFTTISEAMEPDDVVNSLNRYFNYMVDIIMNRNGVIDKYIGDAIMAFFGAPVKHDNDPLQAVLTGIEMYETLNLFNREQKKIGKPEFQIGVGINYGMVTVGNIGTERKMDYTVIGDIVNVASRLEGLTKHFKHGVLIAEPLYEEVQNDILCRLVGSVAVKGKTEGLKVFAVAKKDSKQKQHDLWGLHNEAMDHYFNRDFASANEKFSNALTLEPEDYLAHEMNLRCIGFMKKAPKKNWTGVEVMTEK